MLVKLLNMFKDEQETIGKASDYIAEYSDSFELYQEFGAGRLGHFFHQDFQGSVLDILRGDNDNGNLPTPEDKIAFEEIIRKELRKKMDVSINSIGQLTEKAEITKDDICNHFIEDTFEPLLKAAREINELTQKPN